MEHERSYQHSRELNLDEKRKSIEDLGYNSDLVLKGIWFHKIGKEIGALGKDLNPDWYKEVAQHLGIPKEEVTHALKEVIGFCFDYHSYRVSKSKPMLKPVKVNYF